MPILHCSNCHHEWEYIGKDWEHDLCEWCGCTPYKIADKCDLEKLADIFNKKEEEDDDSWDIILERMGDTPQSKD